MVEEQTSGVQRSTPDLPAPVLQSVEQWQNQILSAKKYFEKDFKRMRENMMVARQGASDDWLSQGNYTVPIINRYINQSVASLYAKNPTAIAKKRKTLDFQIWDGKVDTASAAMQGMAMGDPSAAALLADIEQGRQKQNMAAKIGSTLEVLFDYFSNEQKPRLKPSMKQFVRRTKTCGVGYIMLGFQRQYAELSPDDTARLEDARNQLGELQRRMQDTVDGVIDDGCQSEAYELETLINQLQSQSMKILREGPVFMFPRSTEIIIDPNCKQLRDFVGAGWVAREFHKTPKEIQKIYNIDLKDSYQPYNKHKAGDMAEYYSRVDSDDSASEKSQDKKNGMVCVWEVYNKTLGQTFTIADGYSGYLVEPKEPDYWMEGFWPMFALTFNNVESEDHLYPLSDVELLKHVQAEYNRSREYRRLHREANKPKYFAVKGRLSENDKELLRSHAPNSIIELEGMGQNEDVNKLVRRFESSPMDPALYETNSEMEDVLRTVGAQEANIGGVSGGTATESSIAEGSRMTSLASNVDDLDEFLSDLVSAFGQLLLMELTPETVREIAGVGAVWPELNKEQVAKEVILNIRAGSSGRPNKAAELANIERAMPYLIQMPGINPEALAHRYADLLEIDIDEIIVSGLPSITALNAQMGKAVEPVSNDPNMQGGQGGDNAEQPMMNEPGGQPSYQPDQLVMEFDENGNMI